MFLDTITPTRSSVSWGELGYSGHLGYSDMNVSVQGVFHERALSAHGPSEIVYQLDGTYEHFSASAAICDTAEEPVSADFCVYADGRLVACAPRVRRGDPPRRISAPIFGARELVLRVETNRSNYCHSVWIDPYLAKEPLKLWKGGCGEVAAELPLRPIQARWCIALNATPAFADWLEECLGSLHVHGECQDAQIVLFAYGMDARLRHLADRYGALIVECFHEPNVMLGSYKQAALCVPHIVDAQSYLYLDADTLVVGSLRPLLEGVQIAAPHTVFVCRERLTDPVQNLLSHIEPLRHPYYGHEGDGAKLGLDEHARAYRLIVNSGVYAGSRRAMLALENMFSDLKAFALYWHSEREDIGWREQALFNIALARMDAAAELHPSYNVQLLYAQPEVKLHQGGLTAREHGEPVRVLHFNGIAKENWAWARGSYLNIVPDVLQEVSPRPVGAEAACEQMIARLGRDYSRWAFPSNPHQPRQDRHEPFRLLVQACRESQCQRVVDLGEEAGIAAAYLADAGCEVVSVQAVANTCRTALWNRLSDESQGRITHIHGDPLVKARTLRLAGETFDAAYLTTRHTEQHVYLAITLALELTSGGPVFLHDHHFEHCSAPGVAQRLREKGYWVETLKHDSHNPIYVIREVGP